jgi:hypothetical protein
MALLYGGIAKEFGWTFSEIDELTMADLEDLNTFAVDFARRSRHALEAPNTEPPREISEEEWQRLCAREKAFAADANQRNPFL